MRCSIVANSTAEVAAENFSMPIDSPAASAGGSDTWIASFNTEFDLPIGLPLSLFASAGFVPVTSVTQEGKSVSTASYMEAGIGVQVVRDMLEIWFPLVVSQRIADEEEFQDRQVTDRVRFVFALERMDPTKILRGLKP